MNRIVLVVLSDCESCHIVEKKLRDCIKTFKKSDIKFEVKVRENCNKSFLKINRINDFPTALFYKDTNIVFKFTGNYPSIVITQWLHNYYIDT